MDEEGLISSIIRSKKDREIIAKLHKSPEEFYIRFKNPEEFKKLEGEIFLYASDIISFHDRKPIQEINYRRKRSFKATLNRNFKNGKISFRSLYSILRILFQNDLTYYKKLYDLFLKGKAVVQHRGRHEIIYEFGVNYDNKS